MSWGLAFDILLVAVAALSQSITGYLGWRVTVDGGAPDSKKKRYEILFAACVVLGVLATVGIAYRGGNIGKDLDEIKRAQHEQGKELHQIEENQKQQPNIAVTVPSPPKQRAIMALSRKTADDGIEIIKDPQYPQFGWVVNISCKNIGQTVTAKRVSCPEYAQRIPATYETPTKDTLQTYWNDFSKRMSASHPPQSVDLDPGSNSWGTVGLSMLDVDPELNSGSKVIFVAGAILYSDEAGPHKKEFCRWAQPPFNPPNPTWHFCEIGHNREVY